MVTEQEHHCGDEALYGYGKPLPLPGYASNLPLPNYALELLAAQSTYTRAAQDAEICRHGILKRLCVQCDGET